VPAALAWLPLANDDCATSMFSLDHRTFLEQDFAVIDPLQVDASLWKHLPAMTLGETEFDCDTAKLPHLLCLRDADELARLELLDLSQAFTADEDTAFFCALIRTKESPSSLTRRLSQRMVLTRRSNGQKYFFRYFDPRVFLHLPRILTDEQMSTLLAPAAAWAWRDPLARQWREHCVAVQAAAMWPAPTLAANDKQLDGIARIDLVNQVLQRLQAETGEQAVAQSVLPAIDAHALRAIEAERLTDANDQAQFVLDAIEYGPQVHQTSAVRQVLEGARSQQTSYVGGMNALGKQGILAAMHSSRPQASS
jgi:hypothetical protein